MTASKTAGAVAVLSVILAVCAGAGTTSAETGALTLRATVLGPQAPAETLRIELLRWSTDPERAPLLTEAATLNRPPAPAAAAAAPAGGRAGGGGRGRGRGAETPASPLARLTSAIKAAPTIGFIWGEGATGYSIKYAWHAAQPDGSERIVLVTDRLLGSHSSSWPGVTPGARAATSGPPASAPAPPAEFTVIEMRIDGKGSGEGKTSLTTRVVVDAAAQTLALDGYAAATPLLKVVR